MNESQRPPGKTTIAPDVLLTIARLTTLSVPGVVRMAPLPVGVNILLREESDGVSIVVENNTVYIDLYVVVSRDLNVRDISRAIQSQVFRAISEMVGMEVGKINVHVEDVDFGSK
jgi:uncharacterized alkaline shock family protein YloU